MNLSWPHRAAGKSGRRGAARVWMIGATVVATAGAVTMAAPAMSAMAATRTAKHATTTKMSAVSGYAGKDLTLAARVAGSTPKGTVKFTWDGKTLCSATLSRGTAKCGHAFATGSYRVKAEYMGNSTHTPSSGTATVSATAYATSEAITIQQGIYSPTLNWEPGGFVTVPFTVMNKVAGGPAPTGSITITAPVMPDQAVAPPPTSFKGCTGNLTPGANGVSKGSCQVWTPTEAWGFVLMRATYNPKTSTFKTSNTFDTEYKIINQIPTATTVVTTTAAADAAGEVTLEADVVPAGFASVLADTPGGDLLAAHSEYTENGSGVGDTVAFTIDQGGAAVATCTEPDNSLEWNGTTDVNFEDCGVTLAAGTYSVVATFSSDEYAAASTSAAVTLTVTAAG
jgi:hypothetical protein